MVARTRSWRHYPNQATVPTEPRAAARFWVERNVVRWQEVLAREARDGLVVVDTDPFKLHYVWTLVKTGQVGEVEWLMQRDAARDALEAGHERVETELERGRAVRARDLVPVLEDVGVCPSRQRWRHAAADAGGAGFPIRETDHVRLRSGENVEGRARIKTRIAKERHHRSGRSERAGIAELERREQRDRVGMAQQELSVVACECAEGVLPASAARDGQDQFRQQSSDDRFEEHGLRSEVTVQRHGLDAERGAQTAHRERLEALSIDELDRCLDDPFRRERRAP